MLGINNWPPECVGPPTVNAFRIVKEELGIPLVMFWYDIYVEQLASILDSFAGVADLHVLFAACSDSHRQFASGINYVYAGLAFEDSLFEFNELPRDIDIGFLGTLWPERSNYIADLAKADLRVFTTGGILIKGAKAVPRSDKESSWISYNEYLKLLSRLKISLNFSSLQVSKYQVRARVWESLWSKTFLLEEENPVTDKYFAPNEDYVPFSSPGDLVEKVKYYLLHDNERDRIRLHGWSTIKTYYSAKRFWKNLFGILTSGDVVHSGLLCGREYFASLGG
jgi:spore maturation protein CgeB